jgi:hypothetical protein
VKKQTKRAISARKKPKAKAWAHNAVEASRELKVTRLTLRRWLDLEGTPGRNAAGKYDLRAGRSWMEENKAALVKTKAEEENPAPVSRKKQIEEELAEIELRKAKREEADADSRTMHTEEVDGLIFEVLANFDFHLMNAERELTIKVASRAKLPAANARAIVKPSFDSFRLSFRDFPLPPEAKRYINEWHDLPPAIRAKIIAGKYSIKEKAKCN